MHIARIGQPSPGGSLLALVLSTVRTISSHERHIFSKLVVMMLV